MKLARSVASKFCMNISGAIRLGGLVVAVALGGILGVSGVVWGVDGLPFSDPKNVVGENKDSESKLDCINECKKKAKAAYEECKDNHSYSPTEKADTKQVGAEGEEGEEGEEGGGGEGENLIDTPEAAEEKFKESCVAAISECIGGIPEDIREARKKILDFLGPKLFPSDASFVEKNAILSVLLADLRNPEVLCKGMFEKATKDENGNQDIYLLCYMDASMNCQERECGIPKCDQLKDKIRAAVKKNIEERRNG